MAMQYITDYQALSTTMHLLQNIQAYLFRSIGKESAWTELHLTFHLSRSHHCALPFCFFTYVGKGLHGNQNNIYNYKSIENLF